jgi:hypothetical protein
MKETEKLRVYKTINNGWAWSTPENMFDGFVTKNQAYGDAHEFLNNQKILDQKANNIQHH